MFNVLRLLLVLIVLFFSFIILLPPFALLHPLICIVYHEYEINILLLLLEVDNGSAETVQESRSIRRQCKVQQCQVAVTLKHQEHGSVHALVSKFEEQPCRLKIHQFNIRVILKLRNTFVFFLSRLFIWRHIKK